MTNVLEWGFKMSFYERGICIPYYLVYKSHSCIGRTPNFGTEFQGKKVISCISRTPTLEDRRQAVRTLGPFDPLLIVLIR